MNLDLVGISLDEGGLARLQTLLSGERSNAAAQQLITHVRSLGAKFAILEKPYTDHDYSADFLSFYAAAFKTYPRFTERLHFFTEDVSAIFSMPLGDQADALAEHPGYLGFVVVRPIKQGPIGRTVLRFPKLDGDLVVRPAARASFKVHLYGADLKVAAAPFIQQDTRVGACAQAAIWMANRPLHERHGRCGWHPISDITRLATTPTDQDLSKSLPAGSSGLSPLHITRALRAMGHQPYCDIFLKDDEGEHSKTCATDTEKSVAEVSPGPSIVRYLDSGLPVILGMSAFEPGQPGHAITAVGYVETRGKSVRESDTYDSFVRAIVVHDDQRGPYLLMPMTTADIEHLPQDRLIKVDGVPICVENAVTHIFVPLSPRVFLIADHADIVAKFFLLDYAKKLASFTAKQIGGADKAAESSLEEFAKAVEDGRIVRRTYLTTAGRYRHHLAKSDLHEDAKIETITRTLPHFVWVTELLYRDAEQREEDAARPIIGHIVMNATSSTDPDNDLLIAHLPYLLVQRNIDVAPGSDAAYEETATFFPGYAPYKQRLRN